MFFEAKPGLDVLTAPHFELLINNAQSGQLQDATLFLPGKQHVVCAQPAEYFYVLTTADDKVRTLVIKRVLVVVVTVVVHGFLTRGFTLSPWASARASSAGRRL